MKVITPSPLVAEAAEVLAPFREAIGWQRSEVPHERNFTWVRGDLKVQMVRGFHPFPTGVAKRLPQNTAFGMASDPASQEEVAFTARPGVPRLRCANAACLLALKEAAFGRTRPGSAVIVRRDFHDAFLLIDAVAEDLAREWHAAGREVQERGRRAIGMLADGGEATMAAANEMVRLGQADSIRGAEARIRRTARAMLRTLDR